MPRCASLEMAGRSYSRDYAAAYALVVAGIVTAAYSVEDAFLANARSSRSSSSLSWWPLRSRELRGV